MPRLSRVQRDAHYQLRQLANRVLLPEQLGSLFLHVLRQAIACDSQVLFGVDPTSLLFNRLLAVQEQQTEGHLQWLETIYLANEPCSGATFPGMMRTHISAMVLHDRVETSWGTPANFFHPFSERSYSRWYHEIETPSGGILRACFAVDGQWIAALEMHRLDAHRPFAPTDVAFVRLVAPLIGHALRSALDWERAHICQDLTGPAATGVLIISPRQILQIATPAAQTWMGFLREQASTSNAHLPIAVLSALASLRASPQQSLPQTILASTPAGLLRIEASLASEDGTLAVILAPHGPFPQPELPVFWPLTRRERQVCDLLLSGHSNQQIAATLVISKNTVEAHCAHVYEKLGVHSRSELLALFFREVYKSS